MDLLYREGGLNNAEIGRLLKVDYSTVSQERKKLRDILRKDKKLSEVVSSLDDISMFFNAVEGGPDPVLTDRFYFI